ncbi:MAG: tetraprenyl-beta-curcumene synthase family protein [Negativicutes bacterium]|jgi:tetraprenyl-beta-curcumene synthase
MFASLKNSAASFSLITKFVRQVFPLVNAELAHWRHYAEQNGCHELREQALASIRDKKFHCQGGSVYSLYRGVSTPDFVRLVVALQTISDYLDNLCDRAGVADELAFRQLHLAMTDALDPGSRDNDYYRFYPFKDDGGYLKELIKTCRQEVAKLPSYHLVKADALKFASLYSELQTYKHLDLAIREDKMKTWIDPYLRNYPEISNWEFAAATGSTLGMFMLCAAASDPNLKPSDAAKFASAYFPWINGLHILLDYFIDAAEDLANGDLNFVAYYKDHQETLTRLELFTKQALAQAEYIPEPIFTTTIIHGLLAMYLSDPKTERPAEQAIRAALLETGGIYTGLVYQLCRLLRKKSIL